MMGSLLGGEGSLPGSCSLAFAVAVVDGGGARAGRREEGKRAGQRPLVGLPVEEISPAAEAHEGHELEPSHSSATLPSSR